MKGFNIHLQNIDKLDLNLLKLQKSQISITLANISKPIYCDCNTFFQYKIYCNGSYYINTT